LELFLFFKMLEILKWNSLFCQLQNAIMHNFVNVLFPI